jgi:molecular chaperone Hsp31 and glyoxalase 3
MIKKILGIAPKLESDGSYSPSKLALKLATKQKTDYESIVYKKYQGKKSKILVIFTEHKNMTMQNGKLFSTGNHPVEALLPMMHLKNAGFSFEIVTPYLYLRCCSNLFFGVLLFHLFFCFSLVQTMQLY